MEPVPSSTTPQLVPPSGSPAPNAAAIGAALTNVAGTAATAEPLQMEEVVSTNAVTAEAIARQNQTVVRFFPRMEMIFRTVFKFTCRQYATTF